MVVALVSPLEITVNFFSFRDIYNFYEKNKNKTKKQPVYKCKNELNHLDGCWFSQGHGASSPPITLFVI